MDLLFIAKGSVDKGVGHLVEMAEQRLRQLRDSPGCYTADDAYSFCGLDNCPSCNEVRDLLAAVTYLRSLWDCEETEHWRHA